jgi:hypothetical protein
MEKETEKLKKMNMSVYIYMCVCVMWVFLHGSKKEKESLVKADGSLKGQTNELLIRTKRRRSFETVPLLRECTGLR